MATIDDIKSTLSRIDESSINQEQPGFVDNGSLMHKLKNSYNQLTFKDVSSLLENNNNQEALRASFIHYLARNEKLISGSALYYTCTPEEPTTQLLCLIAKWISETSPSEAPVSAISLLMPSLDLEAKYTTKYPSLCVEKDNIEDHLTSDENDTRCRLLRIRESRRTDEENAQLQTLEAKYEQSESYHKHCNIINGWRMPKVSLERVLATHILSEDGLTLIPMSLITEEDDAINPYSATYAKLTHDEMHRIKNHSTFTECYISVKENHERLRNDNSHLLGHITTLCQKLKLYDAHGGMGAPDSAEAGAYPAIISFNQYYRDLDETEKQKIPVDVKNEIDTLLDLSSDKDKNMNATETIATCIGLRRKALEGAVKNHGNELSIIARTDAQKQFAFMEAKEVEEKYKSDLQEELSSGRYSGKDSLPYRASLFNALNIEPSIKSLSDFNTFMKMSADDIKEFGKITSIHDALKNTIVDTNDFAAFVRDTPDLKLESYFEIVGSEILLPLNNLNKIRAVLFEISASKVNLLLNLVDFNDVIKKHSDLSIFIKHLPPEQCAAFRKSIITRRGRRFDSPFHFKCDLTDLSPEQRTAVYESIKEQLPSMINLAGDLYNVLECLSREQRTEVYASIKEQLTRIITLPSDYSTAARDLSIVLEYLSPEQRTEVYESLKTQLPGMLKSSRDLMDVLRHLNLEQRIAVYALIKPQLPNIIQSRSELISALVNLPTELWNAVHESISINEQPANRMITADELSYLLQHSDHEQRIAIFEFLKAQLPSMIKDAENLLYTLKYLSLEQCSALCDLLKEQLPNIIKNASDLVYITSLITGRQHIEPHKIVIVYESIKAQLPNMIKSANDLRLVMMNLAPEQRTDIYELIKGQLPSMIVSSVDLANAFQHLTLEQINESIHLVKAHLNNLFDDAMIKFRAKANCNDNAQHDNIESFIRQARIEADTILAANRLLTKHKFHYRIKEALEPILKDNFPHQNHLALRILADVLMVVFFPVGIFVAASNMLRTGNCFFSPAKTKNERCALGAIDENFGFC